MTDDGNIIICLGMILGGVLLFGVVPSVGIALIVIGLLLLLTTQNMKSETLDLIAEGQPQAALGVWALCVLTIGGAFALLVVVILGATGQ